MSSTLQRLAKVEAAVAVAQETATKASGPVWLTEDELADVYSRWHSEGWAAGETGLPRAIAFLRESLAAAHAAGQPTFDPPQGWRTFGHPVCNNLDWRAGQFPAIREAVEWLEEIERRVTQAIPPVTEAEFAELAAWFERNRERLQTLQKGDCLDLGNGERAPTWHGTYGVRKGPRAEGAGRTAELIRMMKSAYPEATHV